MNPRILLERFGAGCAALGALLLFAGLAQSADAAPPQEQQSSKGQQQSSQQQQNPDQSAPPPAQPTDPSAPKPKKVWTNDDVITLRSPADIYQAEKEAQEAADAKEAARRAELAKQIKEAGLAMTLPATPEETQREIKVKEGRIADFQDVLDRLNKDLPDAPEDQQAGVQKQIDLFTTNLQKAQLELKVLKNHLQSLSKSTPTEPPPPSPSSQPPAPPSPENPQ